MTAVKEAKMESNDGPPKIKQRPIVRLGIFLISHSPIVSMICSVAGVLALLLLPVLAKNTYISENALMPGSARSMLSNGDVSDGSKLVKNIKDVRLKHGGREVQRLIGKYMSDLGAEVYHHKFHPEVNRFHPLYFFSGPGTHSMSEDLSCSSYGVNVAGIIRAPRGDGKESIVLVTPYDPINGGKDEVLSLGIVYSLFSLLSRATWLAKDIIWLVADSRYGDYRPVATWLSEYYTPSFKTFDFQNCKELNTSDSFRRAGTMAAALVLKVDGRSEVFEDTLTIYAEASNGQMPNLDLINVVNNLAVHRQGFNVKVEKVVSLLSSSWLKTVGQIVEAVGKVAKIFNPDSNFGIPAADYIESSATLASSMYYQALGVPTGPHGAFREYQVDAITLKISPRFPPETMARQQDFFLRGARLIEGTVRSVNNLLEKLHQSFFLYLLTSPGKFVSVGVYMIAFALLIAPLPMVAAWLYMEASNSRNSNREGRDKDEREVGGNRKSWVWVEAGKRVGGVHLWGAVVSLLPYLVGQNVGVSRSVMWGTTSGLALFMMPGTSCTEWTMLKAVGVSATFIGLCLMSIVNFAAAEMGALVVVPMWVMIRPMKEGVRRWRRVVCNVVLMTVGFPPIAFWIVGKGEGGFWEWVESLWAWNSATYLYLALVHLPSWFLCISIFFHPSY